MRNALSMAAVTLAIAFVAVSTSVRAAPAAPADVDVPTTRGVALKATLHKPEKSNGTAVVIAPGQKANRDSLVVKRSAEGLAAAGFTVLRFDWACFTADPKDGAPSADLVNELADVDAAVAFARKQEGVTKLVLAGKSLGSMAALAWSNAHPDALAGLALLTWPASNPQVPGELYEGADRLEKSAMAPLIVCGDRDPLADLQILYKLAAGPERAPKVVIVPGDHSFGTGTKGDPIQDENVALAVQHLVLWAKRQTLK